MKPSEREDSPEGCNCLNCRLERMEQSIRKMTESVGLLASESKETGIPGMPKDRNKIVRK